MSLEEAIEVLFSHLKNRDQIKEEKTLEEFTAVIHDAPRDIWPPIKNGLPDPDQNRDD